MFRLLIVLFALVAPAMAAAQRLNTPIVTSVEITEYGVYAVDAVERSADPDAPIGYFTSVTNVRLIERTDIICPKLRRSFGVRFVAIGAPANTPIELEWVTRFPPGGVTNSAGRNFTESRLRRPATIGVPDYRSFTFDEPQEIVHGPWVLEFYYRGRKVGEKTFEMKPGCSGVS